MVGVNLNSIWNSMLINGKTNSEMKRVNWIEILHHLEASVLLMVVNLLSLHDNTFSHIWQYQQTNFGSLKQNPFCHHVRILQYHSCQVFKSIARFLIVCDSCISFSLSVDSRCMYEHFLSDWPFLAKAFLVYFLSLRSFFIW